MSNSTLDGETYSALLKKNEMFIDNFRLIILKGLSMPQLMLARYITQFIRTFDMSWFYQIFDAVFSKEEFIDLVQKNFLSDK